MYEKKVGYAYLREMGLGMAVYISLLVVSIVYGRGWAPGLERTLFLASPVIGVVLVCWAIARHVRRVDEYIRKETLENIAVAAVLTAGLTFTYGFLETAGFPKLTMFLVWVAMGTSWAVVTLLRCGFARAQHKA